MYYLYQGFFLKELKFLPAGLTRDKLEKYIDAAEIEIP